jgi:hypothetical protein
MPGVIPTGTSRSFGLYISGVNLTNNVPSETVRITEVAGESNAMMEFGLEGNLFGFQFMNGGGTGIYLQDLTNGRTLFRGNLVNLRRRHGGGSFAVGDVIALSLDAWLDRMVLPKWVSKRPNGTAITNDREQVQNLWSLATGIPGGNPGGIDAINTYVSSTNSSMPVVKVQEGGSVRDILSAIAAAAATVADPTARRFYVDFDGHLHYFKGNESTTAPYRIGDANYVDVIKATSGLISLWPLTEAGGATAYDTQAYAHASLNGGYTQNVASLVPNLPGNHAITFNGSTGFASATGANLHQGDGPWSIELWFRRGATLGTAQTMVSAGLDDYEIGFNSSNQIVVYKEGTGNNFVTDATYTDTNPHHLVVSRPNGGATTVKVDGSSKSGTTTARTFVSAAGAINIGRRLSSTDRYFTGTLQDVAFYNTALSAATILAHYNDGWTIVPDEFEFESDYNDSGIAVYIKGGTSSGTGWVGPDYTNSRYFQTFILDRPESTTAGLKAAIGTGFLKREAPIRHSFRATITMPASTWRAGQTVTIDDTGLGIDGSASANSSYPLTQTYEIKQLETVANLGSGMVTYTIYGGALPWSGNFAVQRKKRRR